MSEQNSIGAGTLTKTKVRTPQGQPAMEGSKPVAASPADQPIEIGGHKHVEARRSAAPEGGAVSAMNGTAAISIDAICGQIVELQRTRRHCIRIQQKLNRSTDAFIASVIGYDNVLGPKERKALFARAAAMRKQVEDAIKNGGHHHVEARLHHAPVADGRGHALGEALDKHALAVCAPIIQHAFAGREGFDTLRRNTEKAMQRLARTLPVNAWRVENAPGFGALGLAIVVGEAAEAPGNYRSVSALWKRLGLAVIRGERQRRVAANAELAIEQGYSPQRRAEMWVLADSMFKKQWAGAKDDSPPGPIGAYGAVYQRRRARTAVTHPDWPPAHQNADARRVMFKALLADLWGAWTGKAKPAAGQEMPEMLQLALGESAP